MSEQNPTQKAPPAPEGMMELPVPAARCPHCGRVMPGMNVLEMQLPTEQGNQVWLLPSCPYIEAKDGKAADGGDPCGRVISAQMVGYAKPQIARPGSVGWS